MTKRIGEPFLSIWFGNFYRPAFDDRDFVDESMDRLRAMGFNAVMLDSKEWQDFQDRFQGGEASEYVAQQEYMMAAAARAGLAHDFLALYCNGDNLYPAIRFSPPVLGEGVTGPEGKPWRWYKYWSPAARESQRRHVEGLFRLYREGHAALCVDGKERLPICSMWDPVTAPSFDLDGKNRYLAWLQNRYGHISAFNAAYQTDFSSFDALRAREDWFVSALHGDVRLTPEDIRSLSPAFVLWADRQQWKADELTAYFADMQRKLHDTEPDLYLMPDLSQWGYFLNVCSVRKGDVNFWRVWDTATRGLDARALSPYVDMCHYYTVPVTTDGDPDAYAVACQHAHIRSLNPGRPFFGGIYYGRYLYNDLYRFLTPEEIVGSIVASGAQGICAYGYCGMDDGGLLHRMDEGFVASLTRANDWARQVIPALGKRKKSRVALLFPSVMSLLEPLTVEGAAERRNDLLGLYRLCCDWGFAPDIVEPPDVVGGLSEYDALLIPTDSCYHARRNEEMEKALRGFVESGGVVIHSQGGQPAEFAFDLHLDKTEGTCYTYDGEGGLLLGGPYASYPGQPLALWREDGKPCISRTAYGRGFVYSFGFLPGYQAAARAIPHVPYAQHNDELYPFPLMQRNPLRRILLSHAAPDMPISGKDVECAAFENGLVVINHRSTPVSLPLASFVLGQQPISSALLPAHSAAWVRL